MTDFFVPLAEGIYRSGSRLLQNAADGVAWTEAYDHLLARHDAVVTIVDAAQRPAPQAGKPLAQWLKARREELGAKVRLTVYVVEDAGERAAMEERTAKAGQAFPYPIAVAASFEEAEHLARTALAAGRA